MRRAGIHMTTPALLAAAALLVAALVPTHAPAAPAAITLTQENFFHPGDADPFEGIAALPLLVPDGQELAHVNLDIEGHNITADEVDDQDVPIFAGTTINRFQATTIDLSHLAPGDYAFHCTIHPFMQGVLTII